MSYHCDRCGEVHQDKPQNKRVDEIRTVNYEIHLMKSNRGMQEKTPYFYKGAEGWEIISEQRLCDICAKIMADVPPRVAKTPKVLETVGTKPKETLEEEKTPYRNDYERDKYEDVERVS